MRKRELIAVCSVLLISTITSVIAYARITEIERPQFTLFETLLTTGDNKFIISSHEKCVGKILINIEKERATTAHLVSVFHAKIQKKEIDVNLKGKFYFNPLGQMTDSSVSIESLNLSLSAETIEINPIKAKVKINALGKDYVLDREILGPLLISEYEPSKIRIEYNQFEKEKISLLEGPTTLIKNEFDLNIVAVNDLSQCNKSNNTRLDLDRVLPFIKKLSNQNNLEVEL